MDATSPSTQWLHRAGVQYLDHGAFGGVPKTVFEAQTEARRLIEADPHDFFERHYVTCLRRSKEALASFLGVDTDGLVLVSGATNALNIVIQSKQFCAGDEILTTNCAYSSVKQLLDTVGSRSGAAIVVADIKFPVKSSRDITRALLDQVTDRTRMAIVDHLPSRTGIIFPIEEIVSELTARGIETVVDGAHVPGMFPFDIQSINAPYYAANCHKWMCSPRGVGFLYVREDKRESLRPLIIARSPYAADACKHSSLENQFDWPGTFDPSAIMALPKAIEFLETAAKGGHAAMFERNHKLALAARDVLCQRLNLSCPTPDYLIGTMVSIFLPDSPESENTKGGKMTAIQRHLWEQHRTQVPIYPWPAYPRRLLRISVQIYNSLEQYEQLAENIATYLATEKSNSGHSKLCKSPAILPDDHVSNREMEREGLICCDPMVKADMRFPTESQRVPLPRKNTKDIRWPSWDILSRFSVHRILYAAGYQEEPPYLLFPTAESENGQHFISANWEQFGNLDTEKSRLSYTLSRYPERGVPASSVSLIDRLLNSPCVLEGWSNGLSQSLRQQSFDKISEALRCFERATPNLQFGWPGYTTQKDSSYLSTSLWGRALECISRKARNAEIDTIYAAVTAFIQIHAFLKDPIDGLRRDFERQVQIFMTLWDRVRTDQPNYPSLEAPAHQAMFAQLAQESSFLAIPKLEKVAYLHFSGHQQLPYVYVSMSKLHRTELSMPHRVLNIAQELLSMVVKQGYCEIAPIAVVYRPRPEGEQGKRFKVIIDGNNRLVAVLLLQFLSYGRKPLLERDGDSLAQFCRTNGYGEQWVAELKRVLDTLSEHGSVLKLIQAHRNILTYFRSVRRLPALVVQEEEFHTVSSTFRASSEEVPRTVLQPAKQTIDGWISTLAFEAKAQSHGRPRSFFPLPLW